MVILLLKLLFGIHAVNTSVLARVIKDYVYTEPGGNVTLNCSNSGGIMQWTFKPRHEDTLLTISENEEIGLNPPELHYHYEVTDAETYNLQIENATSFTEGRYRCLANITTDSIHWFFLLLKAPPSELTVINMTERNIIIGNENENLTLACYTLGGIPRGKTIWYHGKKKLATNEDDNETAYYSLILNRNHNGQIYTCIAIHDMLSSPLNQTITLDILYHPRVQFMRPEGPVSIGQNVNLSCAYYSNPLDAEISWTKNGRNINKSHSIVTKHVVKSERNMAEDIHGITAIMLENVTKTDEGEYTCNVTNTEGSASETVNLVVQDNYSEKEVTKDMMKLPAILIYIVVCCCGLIIFVSSAQIYTCWKSGYKKNTELQLKFTKRKNNRNWDSKMLQSLEQATNNCHIELFKVN